MEIIMLGDDSSMCIFVKSKNFLFSRLTFYLFIVLRVFNIMQH